MIVRRHLCQVVAFLPAWVHARRPSLFGAWTAACKLGFLLQRSAPFSTSPFPIVHVCASSFDLQALPQIALLILSVVRLLGSQIEGSRGKSHQTLYRFSLV